MMFFFLKFLIFNFFNIVEAINTTGLKDWWQSSGQFFCNNILAKVLWTELLTGHLVLACMLFVC